MRIAMEKAGPEARAAIIENYFALMVADLAAAEVNLSDNAAVTDFLATRGYNTEGISEFAARATAAAMTQRGEKA